MNFCNSCGTKYGAVPEPEPEPVIAAEIKPALIPAPPPPPIPEPESPKPSFTVPGYAAPTFTPPGKNSADTAAPSYLSKLDKPAGKGIIPIIIASILAFPALILIINGFIGFSCCFKCGAMSFFPGLVLAAGSVFLGMLGIKKYKKYKERNS
jgi:hypothetical protein